MLISACLPLRACGAHTTRKGDQNSAFAPRRPPSLGATQRQVPRHRGIERAIKRAPISFSTGAYTVALAKGNTMFRQLASLNAELPRDPTTSPPRDPITAVAEIFFRANSRFPCAMFLIFANSLQALTYRKVADYLRSSQLFRETLRVAAIAPSSTFSTDRH